MLSRLIFSVPDGENYYVQATAKQNARRALPEEIIRQLFVLSLLHDYKYPEDRIHLERKIQVGRERKRADIVVLDENGNVLVIIEIKVETDQHSMAQLKSYMALTDAQYGMLVSASVMQCQMRSDRGVFSAIRDIPLFDVASHLLQSNRVPEQTMAAPMTSVSILVEYLIAHIAERLVVSRLDAGMTAQSVRPSKKLSQRYEKDIHTLWVSRKHIKQYLDSHHFDYKRAKDELYARGILISPDSKKVLGAGTDYPGGQTPCWKIRANHPELGALISEPA
jgi:hypothetical protein